MESRSKVKDIFRKTSQELEQLKCERKKKTARAKEAQVSF